LYEIYKSKLNLSVKINKTAKLNLEQQIASKIKTDSKSFFSYVNSKKKSFHQVGPIKDENGLVVSDNKEIAQKLNKYFGSVFSTETVSNIDESVSVFNGDVMQPLDTLEITETIVLNKLVNININKSQGPDTIHGRLLYELREELKKPLCIIYNKSLSSGNIPLDWKMADVIPIFKKGHKQNKENYRPVSLTSIVCKILETIIKDCVVSFLETNNLIDDSQHGFIKGKSCLSNLLDFFEILTKQIDQGKCVDVIFLDFSKAFDKVPHNKLRKKLRDHGIRGNIENWINGWLSGRQQRVVIEGEHSNWIPVTSGVPQGSVLGPVLFIIYINDINYQIKSKLNKFADDCKVMGEVSNLVDKDIIQHDLDELYNWSVKWQMPFNIEKCSIMHFGTKNPHFQYNIGNKILKESDEEKDLGVLIDPSLKFSK